MEAMYREAIANREDRFVIPSTHREYAENAFNVGAAAASASAMAAVKA